MSITAPLLNDNLTELPPEVVKALKIKPSSTLVYEIEEGGKVLLSVKPRRVPKSKSKSNSNSKPKPKPKLESRKDRTATSARLPVNLPNSSKKTDDGRMEQLLKIAATFPRLKPGVKPATTEELNEIIAQRAVARCERSLK